MLYTSLRVWSKRGLLSKQACNRMCTFSDLHSKARSHSVRPSSRPRMQSEAMSHVAASTWKKCASVTRKRNQKISDQFRETMITTQQIAMWISGRHNQVKIHMIMRAWCCCWRGAHRTNPNSGNTTIFYIQATFEVRQIHNGDNAKRFAFCPSHSNCMGMRLKRRNH